MSDEIFGGPIHCDVCGHRKGAMASLKFPPCATCTNNRKLVPHWKEEASKLRTKLTAETQRADKAELTAEAFERARDRARDNAEVFKLNGNQLKDDLDETEKERDSLAAQVGEYRKGLVDKYEHLRKRYERTDNDSIAYAMNTIRECLALLDETKPHEALERLVKKVRGEMKELFHALLTTKSAVYSNMTPLQYIAVRSYDDGHAVDYVLGSLARGDFIRATESPSPVRDKEK